MIMLGVTNVDGSVRFYRDTVGLTLQSASSEFAFFATGVVTLALNAPLGRSVKPLAGATEVVFPVASVRAAHETLSAQGCVFATAPRVVTGESWAASFRDPDGHLLTLFGGE